MHHARAGARVEELARQMQRIAGAGGTEGELGGRVLAQRDQLLHRVRRHLGMHRQEITAARRHVGHRCEIAAHIVGEFFLGKGIGRKRGRGQQQRVTIRRTLRHQIGTDDAVGPGAVVHHQLLAELRRDLRRHQPRHRIRRPRPETDDQAHRAGGVISGDGGSCECKRGEARAEDASKH